MSFNKIEKLLESIEEFLERNNFPLLSKLAPGISSDKISPRNFNGEIPEDMKILYRWRNGIKPEFNKELIGRLTLFSGGVPIAIEKVWWFQDTMGGDSEGWSRSNIPIFESGGGDFYLINCEPADPEYGRILYYSPGAVDFESNISMYDSLFTLLKTTYESYKIGVYTIDDRDMLAVDYPRERAVARELNPKSKYWRLFE